MTPEESRTLKAGDLIHHPMIEATWVVTYVHNDAVITGGRTRVTAVRTIDIVDVSGWERAKTRRAARRILRARVI